MLKSPVIVFHGKNSQLRIVAELRWIRFQQVLATVAKKIKKIKAPVFKLFGFY